MAAWTLGSTNFYLLLKSAKSKKSSILKGSIKLWSGILPKITLDEAELEMVIAENVEGSQGQLLLVKGVVITAKHIRIMKTWGVSSLIVEGDDDQEQSEIEIVITEEMLNQAAKIEAPRFKHADMEQPVIQFLWQEKLKRRALSDFKRR